MKIYRIPIRTARRNDVIDEIVVDSYDPTSYDAYDAEALREIVKSQKMRIRRDILRGKRALESLSDRIKKACDDLPESQSKVNALTRFYQNRLDAQQELIERLKSIGSADRIDLQDEAITNDPAASPATWREESRVAVDPYNFEIRDELDAERERSFRMDLQRYELGDPRGEAVARPPADLHHGEEWDENPHAFDGVDAVSNSRTVRTAQSLESKVKFVRKVFDILEKDFGVKRVESQEGYALNVSIEVMDEGSPYGTSYTQVVHRRDVDGFYVETYYENEAAQNEWGKKAMVAADYVDLKGCMDRLRAAISSTSGRRA